MALSLSHIEQLESILFRRSVGALEADRSYCADCGRTPLAGERIHVYAGRRTRVVCDLCRLSRRDAPTETETVRQLGPGTVRLTARAA